MSVVCFQQSDAYLMLIMKRCVKCGEYKDETDFAWRWKNVGIRQKACRDCRKIENSQWYDRHGETHRMNIKNQLTETRLSAREFLWQYLAMHPCVDCGERDPVVLEFDHVKGRKKHNISAMAGNGYSIEAIRKEIAKCEVRCANCHRRKTAEERGWFRK